MDHVTKGLTHFRQLKEHVHRILAADSWERDFTGLIASGVPAQRTISPLFAALHSTSQIIRWHAVSCFGIACAELARDGQGGVRVVLRRCTWSLNDESGGIGWGAPEAMGEILASVPELAEDYASILISFILKRDEACNFLEYAPLREGAYWGIARLAQQRPDLIRPWRDFILDAIDCETSPHILGRAALILSPSGIASDSDRARRFLARFNSRSENIILYWDRAFWNTSLRDLAVSGEPQKTSLISDRAQIEPAR